MTRLALLTAAAMLTTIAAAPAVANDVSSHAQMTKHRAGAKPIRHQARAANARLNANARVMDGTAGADDRTNASAAAPARGLASDYADAFRFNTYNSNPQCTRGSTITLQDGLKHVCQ
jgi:hypothetical protein